MEAAGAMGASCGAAGSVTGPPEPSRRTRVRGWAQGRPARLRRESAGAGPAEAAGQCTVTPRQALQAQRSSPGPQWALHTERRSGLGLPGTSCQLGFRAVRSAGGGAYDRFWRLGLR
ncbi:hypothetical protein NN561_003210 [Cricetulus griseus]